MVELVIVSDSHGQSDRLVAIKQRHPNAEHFIHCGDSMLPFHHEALTGYRVVRGNCDGERAFLQDEVITLSDKRTLFFTHGHYYQVNMQMHRLYYRAKELNAQIVCYGHTHCIAAEVVDNVLMMNPGSIESPRNTNVPTYTLLQLTDDEACIHFLDATSGKELKKITLNLNS